MIDLATWSAFSFPGIFPVWPNATFNRETRTSYVLCSVTAFRTLTNDDDYLRQELQQLRAKSKKVAIDESSEVISAPSRTWLIQDVAKHGGWTKRWKYEWSTKSYLHRLRCTWDWSESYVVVDTAMRRKKSFVSQSDPRVHQPLSLGQTRSANLSASERIIKCDAWFGNAENYE